MADEIKLPRKFSPSRYATLFSVYESYVPFSAMAMQDTCLYIIPLLFLFIPTTIPSTTNNNPSYYFVHPVAPILFIVLAALFSPSPPLPPPKHSLQARAQRKRAFALFRRSLPIFQYEK